MLIEVLLRRENERTPELPAAHQSPVFVNPTRALPEKLGDLLKGHYVKTVIRFKRKSHVLSVLPDPAGRPSRNGSFGGERGRTRRRTL
jgi:hypothetical protein